MEVLILKQLIEQLKALNVTENEPVKGDLYGIQDANGVLFVTTLFSTNHQLQHDPTLLICSSFNKLGVFEVGLRGHTSTFPLQDQEIGLSYFEDELEIFIQDVDKKINVKTYYKIFEEKDLMEKFILCRVCFMYEFLCRDKTADVKNVINKVQEEVSSNNTYFKARNFPLLLQKEYGKSNFSLNGKEKIDINKEIGSLIKISKKKNLPHFDIITFDMLVNKSISSSTAPVVQIDSNKIRFLRTSLQGETVVYISRDLPLTEIGNCLSKSVNQQVQLAEYWLVKQLKDTNLLSPLQSYTINNFLLGYMMTLIYPINVAEEHLKEYRKMVHKAFLFSLDKPVIKKSNKFTFPGEKSSRVLLNPHEAIMKDGKESGGKICLVQGSYGYHHYMQDKFDDNKWGCAYRSLQTLVSWYRQQGYTEKCVPSHREIQQILVDIKDKPLDFLGSKQWIGSMEVGFVLENLLNISCKYLYVSSGSELASKGRELEFHFQSVGTPIMIGGGVFAHTIIGVDWNADTGDIKFLVLDPHYTGSEDLAIIIKQGWCGWKGPDFWNPNAYYNLCLPQRSATF